MHCVNIGMHCVNCTSTVNIAWAPQLLYKHCQAVTCTVLDGYFCGGGTGQDRTGEGPPSWHVRDDAHEEGRRRNDMPMRTQ